jgi:hypothetical protein
MSSGESATASRSAGRASGPALPSSADQRTERWNGSESLRISRACSTVAARPPSSESIRRPRSRSSTPPPQPKHAAISLHGRRMLRGWREPGKPDGGAICLEKPKTFDSQSKFVPFGGRSN